MVAPSVRAAVVAFAAITSLAGAAVVAAPAAQATFPGENGRIAVSGSWVGGDCGDRGDAVGTIAPNGRRLRVLLECGTTSSSPEWYPSGRRLLLFPYAMAPDGSHRHRVARDPGFVSTVFEQSLAPDGRHLVYVRFPSCLVPLSPCSGPAAPEIWRAALDGTASRRLAVGRVPRWSPNGRWIAYWHAGRLHIMDASTGRHRRVLARMVGEPPDWSPDSRRILFVGEGGRCGLDAICATDADGTGRARPIVPGPRHGWQSGVAWSPDGAQIAFWRSSFPDTETIRYAIWMARADGTGLRQIHSSDPRDAEFASTGGLSWGPRPSRRHG